MANLLLPFSPVELAGIGASLGLVSHWTYFIRGEHHKIGHIYVALAFTIPALIFGAQVYHLNVSLSSAAKTTAVLISAFWASLWTSIVIYRLFFHPLRKFPGPLLAKTTKLYHVYLVSKRNNWEVMEELHRKYGPVVRTGPGELSVLEPEAVPLFLGARSRCTKTNWYDMGLPQRSLHTSRDRVTHDKRRRIWDKGFSAKALRDFEGRQKAHSYSLAHQIGRRLDQPLNVSMWFNYYSFDVMGDLAFGKSFSMLENGEMHPALKVVHDGQQLLSYITPVPWLPQILRRIPGATRDEIKFREWRKEQIAKRQKLELKTPDLMSWLLEESEKMENKTDKEQWLLGDAQLIIVAGSDTTAATLVHLFYYLSKYPEQVKKLREELEPLVKDITNFSNQDIQDAPHLNGTINETLRLHPPVPSGLLRLTPPEGVQVKDTYIPGNTIVSTPFHTMGRLESVYPRAQEFIPERWYSQPELLLYKDAYAPFSIGRDSCIGKNLALMELRMVITLLLLQFDVRFAPGEDGTNLLTKTTEAFTIFFADLNLIFSKREATGVQAT